MLIAGNRISDLLGSDLGQELSDDFFPPGSAEPSGSISSMSIGMGGIRIGASMGQRMGMQMGPQEQFRGGSLGAMLNDMHDPLEQMNQMPESLRKAQMQDFNLNDITLGQLKMLNPNDPQYRTVNVFLEDFVQQSGKGAIGKKSGSKYRRLALTLDPLVLVKKLSVL